MSSQLAPTVLERSAGSATEQEQQQQQQGSPAITTAETGEAELSDGRDKEEQDLDD